MWLQGKCEHPAAFAIGGAGSEFVHAGSEEVSDTGVQIACAVIVFAVVTIRAFQHQEGVDIAGTHFDLIHAGFVYFDLITQRFPAVPTIERFIRGKRAIVA